jgi:hypothetical protein
MIDKLIYLFIAPGSHRENLTFIIFLNNFNGLIRNYDQKQINILHPPNARVIVIPASCNYELNYYILKKLIEILSYYKYNI